METTPKDDSAQDRRNESDERENANDGNWDSLRAHRSNGQSYDSDNKNDNSGGAGSTGSEATNSEDNDPM